MTTSRKAQHRNWGAAGLPDLDAFAELAEQAYGALPEPFKRYTGEIMILVADWPDPIALSELDLNSPLELLGLFEGVGIAQGEANRQTGVLPNRIWLFRCPILDYCAANDDRLDDIVRHVLVHEIGHHFGLSDADMEMAERPDS